jgi:rSAM/selenodomain-associated transferase 2
MSETRISIIIPVLNEEECLQKHLPLLRDHLKNEEHEIIVVDGGSNDNTREIAKNHEVHLLKAEKAQRAHQMNLGAQNAEGDIFYFMHADTIPPLHFDHLIDKALNGNNHLGMFAFRFEPSNFWLRINAYFTKYDGLFAGGGDQSLFVKKDTFKELGGFDEKMPFMEDFDFFSRAKRNYSYTILPERMTVSSRKYHNNSYLKVQLVNLYTFLSYKWGTDLDRLAKQYKKWLG